MPVIVIGGHSRNVGKTSVVAGLIAALPEYEWTAAKITQYGHGICSKNGKACHCATTEHSWAISEEQDRSGKSDTSRFLLAGASRVLWVRTEQGKLAQAMPAFQAEIKDARHVILESNSVLQFIQPDLYLSVLDPATADFKSSAREYLNRADALIVQNRGDTSAWQNVSPRGQGSQRVFRIAAPHYVTPEIVSFVRQSLTEKAVAR